MVSPELWVWCPRNSGYGVPELRWVWCPRNSGGYGVPGTPVGMVSPELAALPAISPSPPLVVGVDSLRSAPAPTHQGTLPNVGTPPATAIA